MSTFAEETERRRISNRILYEDAKQTVREHITWMAELESELLLARMQYELAAACKAPEREAFKEIYARVQATHHQARVIFNDMMFSTAGLARLAK